MSKPRVGISRCLLGDEVRYDGRHKRQAELLADLSAHVEWVPVCPEVEVGMGVPREPIHLVAHADGVPSRGTPVRLLGATSGEDWTRRMHEWSAARARALTESGICGFVLKARSPSCGLDSVPIAGAVNAGRGLFAEALVTAAGDLPVSDEEALQDPDSRRAFLDAVHAYRRTTSLREPACS